MPNADVSQMEVCGCIIKRDIQHSSFGERKHIIRSGENNARRGTRSARLS